MLTRVNRGIYRKLDNLIEYHYPVIVRMVAEYVLEDIYMQISRKGYEILGEYILFRLAMWVEADEKNQHSIIKAKGNAGRDVIEAKLREWLNEAWALYQAASESGDVTDLKALFAQHGFVRSPDPLPLTPEQSKMLDDLAEKAKGKA